MRTTLYHSIEWMLLVETGWVTASVTDRWATMLYHPRHLR